jgi:tetrahydromethanopterin S-methyltransferase subunit E
MQNESIAYVITSRVKESIVYVIITSVKSSEIHPLALKRATNAMVRSTMSFAREMMIDLRLKRPNPCL